MNAHSTATLHLCTVCGWAYDPRHGAPEHSITPGTPWEDLPAHWRCPECNVGKGKFTAMRE